MGSIDFSSMKPPDLRLLEDHAGRDNFRIVPTIFLRRSYIDEFDAVLNEYKRGKNAGEYQHILGFAVEGPLLGRSGGVPVSGCWNPTAEEWFRLADMGHRGLVYMVIGPDAVDIDDELDERVSFRDVIRAFYWANVKLALGHFQHTDPHLSAQRTNKVIEFIQTEFGPSPDILLTDHLFNDMPRNFRHAWRGEVEKSARNSEVTEFLTRPWTDESLVQILGPVPALLVSAARSGLLTPVINFDGEHVDLAICKRVVEFLGTNRLIAISDHTDLDEMAGEKLHYKGSSTLRYRSDGVVAAGSAGLPAQRQSMASIGLSESEMKSLLCTVPARVLGHQISGADRLGKVDIANGQRR
ncbi:hypothetical protein [Rhodococcus sp. P1Y]|uniref:hypothetical protein n=1 Tax=Rhodococcus sp. P1Y TaxID=1302308 RepID=UPI0012941279|nr:hypothetical protein [Rhodococcus sp. P1Y]